LTFSERLVLSRWTKLTGQKKRCAMAEKAKSKRDIAAAIIADALGIPVESVNDDTPLGDRWHDVSLPIVFETGMGLILNEGDTAGDIFKQL